MPTSARGLPGHMKCGHGQSGHVPVKNYGGMGKAGIAKKSGRAGKCGHGHALAHHYFPPQPGQLIHFVSQQILHHQLSSLSVSTVINIYLWICKAGTLELPVKQVKQVLYQISKTDS